MLDILQYTFLQNALITALLTSISCGIIGTYIVARRMVFISGGITHASFGGIGIAYFLGLSPIGGAAVFSLFVASGIEFFTDKLRVRNDSAIAIFWSLGMAIGIIFIYLTPGYAPNLMSYLFGSILSVKNTEILSLAVLSLFILIIFSLFYHPILYISFDPQFAKTKTLPVKAFNYILINLIALTIVLNIKVVGIILIISLLTIPQNTAMIFTQSYKRIMVLSSLIALAGTISGITFAYLLDIPSGASIIFTLGIIYLICKLISIISWKS
jgi:zinc transport system permease protein